WAMFCSAGDAVGPLVVGALLWAGSSYRGALLVVAGLVALQATFAVRRPERSDEPPDARAPIRAALAVPRLWAILFAAAICTLLDEIVVALATLRLTHDLGATEALAAASLTLYSLGGLAGATTLDALLSRLSVCVLLAGSAMVAVLALVAVIAAPS